MGESYQIRDQDQVYFFTFQVVGWADIFTRKVYRDIILNSLSFCRDKKGMVLYSYVIMSNHVHLIIRSEQGDLSGLARDFKKFTSKQILKELQTNKKESRREWLEMIFKYHARNNKRSGNVQFWTHENHAVELYDSDILRTKLKYIHENPVRAGWVVKAEDYLYSSAINYSGDKGLIAIDYI